MKRNIRKHAGIVVNKQYLFILLLSSIVNVASGQTSISPDIREFTSNGGGGYVIISGTGTWAATSSETWISIQPRTSGTADDPCIYIVRKNLSHDSRNGNISINDRIHKVVQYGISDSSAGNAIDIAAGHSNGGVPYIEKTPQKKRQNQSQIHLEHGVENSKCAGESGAYLIDKSLGVLAPFGINNGENDVPQSFIEDYHGDMELPAQYADYIRSKNVFKEVVLVDGGQRADYYLSGNITKVSLGSRFFRYYFWSSIFGGGRSHIEMSISILDAAKNIVAAHDIYQKARRTGSVFRSAMWSHKANLQTAVEATKDDVFNYALIGIVQHDPSSVGMLVSINNPTFARDISKMVYYGKMTPTERLSLSYSKMIMEYLQQPSADEYVVDAVAWACMAIGKAKMVDNKPDLKLLMDANTNRKISSKALSAYNEM